MGIKTADGQEWMRIDAACEFFGVTRRTLYNWIAKGKVQTRRAPGGAQFALIDARGWQEPEKAGDGA